MYKVPAKSTDCVGCHVYIHGVGCVHNYNGLFCPDHPGGQDYTGHDVYEPSDWVIETVNKQFRGPFNECTYLCTGYDPRAGFWMKNVDNPADLRNVSERAIGRTFHRIYKNYV